MRSAQQDERFASNFDSIDQMVALTACEVAAATQEHVVVASIYELGRKMGTVAHHCPQMPNLRTSQFYAQHLTLRMFLDFLCCCWLLSKLLLWCSIALDFKPASSWRVSCVLLTNPHQSYRLTWFLVLVALTSPWQTCHGLLTLVFMKIWIMFLQRITLAEHDSLK